MGDVLDLTDRLAERRSEEIMPDLIDAVVDAAYRMVVTAPARKAEYVATHSPTWAAQGAALQALRERAGVTRTALARALGVSPARIGRLERGEPVMDARLLREAIMLYFEREENTNE